MEKVRITFKINKKLYFEFKKLVIKSGIPASQVLVEWLGEFKKIDLNLIKNIPQIDLVEYNFYVDNYFSKKLKNECKELGISLSQYIRLIIYLKTNTTNTNHNNFQDLWLTGCLAELCFKLENLKSYSDSSMLLLSKAKLEIGQINDSESILGNIAIKNLSKKEFFEYESVLADIKIYKAKLNDAKNIILESLEALPENNKDYNSLIARFYLQLAEIELIKGDDFKTQFYNLKSITYADINKDAILIAENYMLLSAVNSDYHNNYSLNEAKNIIKMQNNIYYLGWYYNEESMCQPFLKNIDWAIDSIKKGIYFHTRSGSIMKSYYAYALYSKFLVLKDDFKNAYKNILKADVLRKKTKVNSPFATVDYLKLFIEARSNYSQSLIKFEQQLKKSKNVSDYIKYMYNTMRYIFSDDENDKIQSHIELKKLSTNSKTNTVKKAAGTTIYSKRFEYAR